MALKKRIFWLISHEHERSSQDIDFYSSSFSLSWKKITIWLANKTIGNMMNDKKRSLSSTFNKRKHLSPSAIS